MTEEAVSRISKIGQVKRNHDSTHHFSGKLITGIWEGFEFRGS
jgi:hypothetical protein